MERTRFNTILQSQRHRIYGHALHCLRDPEDAEDVTQEAFLRLWRQGPDIPDERLVAWLLRVVHNLCIDQTRRRRTVRVYFGQPDLLALDNLAAAPSEPDSSEQLGGDLLAALETLPAETRSIMLMHYEQGLKLREISELLDLNLNALKVRLHRARRRLREVLERASRPPLEAHGENG